jgi:predicted ArsR family transcriptional regulator
VKTPRTSGITSATPVAEVQTGARLGARGTASAEVLTGFAELAPELATTSEVRASAADVGVADDSPTRERVARSILAHGPSTATALAERLGLTPAAIRRHLDTLLADGVIEARDQRFYGPRGRGRPAKVFALTDSGRDAFFQAYDDLAASALRFLRETGGDELVAQFARNRVGELEDRYRPVVDAAPPERKAMVLAERLTADGYAAVADPAPGRGGEQLCQHHCPVAHVAEQFPALCEAETEVFARLLGTHVQRLATIAHGDGVCTTYIPEIKLRSAGRTTS